MEKQVTYLQSFKTIMEEGLFEIVWGTPVTLASVLFQCSLYNPTDEGETYFRKFLQDEVITEGTTDQQILKEFVDYSPFVNHSHYIFPFLRYVLDLTLIPDEMDVVDDEYYSMFGFPRKHPSYRSTPKYQKKELDTALYKLFQLRQTIAKVVEERHQTFILQEVNRILENIVSSASPPSKDELNVLSEGLMLMFT